jgi:hypothetical protein
MAETVARQLTDQRERQAPSWWINPDGSLSPQTFSWDLATKISTCGASPT